MLPDMKNHGGNQDINENKCVHTFVSLHLICLIRMFTAENLVCRIEDRSIIKRINNKTGLFNDIYVI